MSTPSSCFLPVILCLLYLETSYILSTLVLSKDKELSCVAYRYFPGGLFRTFLHQFSGIRWCLFSQKDFTFIERCGEFPNVPLLGIRGGITYNPSLALRQFGYARR